MAVRYLHCRETWVVEYQDAEGKMRTLVKDLAPAKVDLFGNDLSAAAFKKEMESRKILAMRKWNELDKSGQPRFSIDDK